MSQESASGQQARASVRYEANKKWRQNHPASWSRQKKRNYARSRKEARRAHQRWSLADEIMICTPQRPCDRVLSKKLGRSVQAIQVHRSKILAQIGENGFPVL